MNGIWGGLVLGALLMRGQGTTLRHSENADLRKELATYYKRLERAVKHGDARTVNSLVTRDYVAVSPEGEHNGSKELLTRQQYGIKYLVPTFHATIRSLVVHANRVEVEVSDTSQGDSFDKAHHSLKTEWIYALRDHWIKVDGTWKLKKTVFVKAGELFNGKILK
ncbi:MAG: hypothetical protein JWN14_2867 [Chthonomonadales bacterium]|nr:hypothetical protein [Chthonomonadales bacterium]